MRYGEATNGKREHDGRDVHLCVRIGGWPVVLSRSLRVWLVFCYCLFLSCIFYVSLASADAPPCRTDLLERLGVSAWHAQGWRGQGVKVAVLDSGFRGYRAHLGAVLPTTVHACSFRLDGDLEAKDSSHGILCAEVVHTLAPEAELLLANWEPECSDQFLEAVRWARRQGARILSCSIIMPSWSDGEGHGRIHRELVRLLASPPGKGRADAGDALFFASAGNTAERHWSGLFEDGGDGYHIWRDDAGVAHRENPIQPWGGERVSVELCCASNPVYEVTVFDASTERIIGRVQSTDGGGICSAVVAFLPESGHDYHVCIRRLVSAKSSAASALPFHLVVLGGTLRYSTSEGSIPFPGDGEEVLAIGAVDALGRRLAYSSCGFKRGKVKPDLVATVPFPSRWRVRPFAGTSAAAPQAAALAALLWSRHPDWNAQQIRKFLQNTARPCPASSPIWETGHGLLHLPPPD